MSYTKQTLAQNTANTWKPRTSKEIYTDVNQGKVSEDAVEKELLNKGLHVLPYDSIRVDDCKNPAPFDFLISDIGIGNEVVDGIQTYMDNNPGALHLSKNIKQLLLRKGCLTVEVKSSRHNHGLILSYTPHYHNRDMSNVAINDTSSYVNKVCNDFGYGTDYTWNEVKKLCMRKLSNVLVQYFVDTQTTYYIPSFMFAEQCRIHRFRRSNALYLVCDTHKGFNLNQIYSNINYILAFFILQEVSNEFQLATIK